MLIMVLSLTTACDDSIGSVRPPDFAKIPTVFAKDCKKPQELPDRGLTQLDVETNWALDRKNLLDCGDLHKQTIEWLQQRDKGIAA